MGSAHAWTAFCSGLRSGLRPRCGRYTGRLRMLWAPRHQVAQAKPGLMAPGKRSAHGIGRSRRDVQLRLQLPRQHQAQQCNNTRANSSGLDMLMLRAGPAWKLHSP